MRSREQLGEWLWWDLWGYDKGIPVKWEQIETYLDIMKECQLEGYEYAKGEQAQMLKDIKEDLEFPQRSSLNHVCEANLKAFSRIHKWLKENGKWA